MVLRNLLGCCSHCLFLPGKTQGISKREFGNVQPIRLPVELGEFGSIGSMDDGHDIAECHGVALVADLPDGHERPRHCSDLEYRLEIARRAAVGEVQLALAEVGDGSTIPHQELLAHLAAGRRFNRISAAMLKRADMDH